MKWSRGVILNMASVWRFSPESKISMPSYAAGKCYYQRIEGSRFYAKEKIRVNAISPGLALTKMMQRHQRMNPLLLS
jgi:NAD(P)-dependent dehydrogenase (short-subunit alcohol dehydrogenase family)